MLMRLLNLLLNMNPHTGDSASGIMWIVIGALVVSLILIIVFVVMGRRNKDDDD